MASKEELPAIRPVAWISYASGAIAAAGVVFLAAMFASLAVGATSQALVVGRINDVLVLVSYLLAVPSVVALGTVLRPHAPGASGCQRGRGANFHIRSSTR